jgi:hypothetical protein
MKQLILTAAILAFAPACGDDNKKQQDAGVKDAPSTIDASPDASCFTNPTTHYEIINACTDSQKIYKNSHPALLGSGGTLPMLP